MNKEVQHKICSCGSEKCDGSILLHPKELKLLRSTKDKILKDNPSSTFKLIDSPSSGESYVKFKELHVCYNKKPLCNQDCKRNIKGARSRLCEKLGCELQDENGHMHHKYCQCPKEYRPKGVE